MKITIASLARGAFADVVVVARRVQIPKKSTIGRQRLTEALDVGALIDDLLQAAEREVCHRPSISEIVGLLELLRNERVTRPAPSGRQ
jgi:hypothetical protein